VARANWFNSQRLQLRGSGGFTPPSRTPDGSTIARPAPCVNVDPIDIETPCVSRPNHICPSIWTGAPRSPRRTWAEKDGRSPRSLFPSNRKAPQEPLHPTNNGAISWDRFHHPSPKLPGGNRAHLSKIATPARLAPVDLRHAICDKRISPRYTQPAGPGAVDLRAGSPANHGSSPHNLDPARSQ
jgi:hypothetical protein